MSLECYKHVLNMPNFVFKTPCNVPLSCRFTSQKCHKRVLNASVFNTSCNIPLLRHFTSQILPNNTRFMVLYARNSRVFAPLMRRKRIANRPFSARISPAICPQTCLFNVANTPVIGCKSAENAPV